MINWNKFNKTLNERTKVKPGSCNHFEIFTFSPCWGGSARRG